MEKKIRRLEIAVIVLSVLFVVSIFVSVYSVSQITMLANKIPDYKEVKADIKLLNDIYQVSSVKADSLHVKDNVIKGYDYTVDKASEFIGFLKKKKNERHKD
jgi:type IV secretory pathway TrbF-like protein